MINVLIKRIIAASIMIAISSVDCFAQIPGPFNQYITHGNFDIYAKAFQRIGLIASDGTYQVLFFGFAILILLIAFFTTFKNTLGGAVGAFPWVNLILRFVIGLAFFSIFVLNTSTFVVFDETTGKFIQVNNVPDGIAAVALIGNKVENGIANIIETSAAPADYGRSFQENPFGVVFDLASNVWGGDVNLMGTAGIDATGTLNQTNIHQYLIDCFLFELDRPGTAVSADDLNNSNDLLGVISQGSNPAVMTTYYSDANKAGQMINCADAWVRINAYLVAKNDADPAVTRFYQEKCSEAGFAERVAGAGGADMVETCKSKIAGFISNEILGAAISASAIFKNVLVSKELHKVFLQETPSTIMKVLGNYQSSSHKISQGLISSEWAPFLKCVLYVSFIGVSPWLLLLLASPYYEKPLMILLGMAVFFTCWTVCEAVLHESAMDAAIAALEDIRNGHLGFRSQVLMQSETLKAAASFAPYQMLAFLVAGSLSAALVKFGGNVMSRMGVSEMEGQRREAQTTANRVAEPSGMATSMDGLSSAIPTMAMHNKFGYQGMSQHKSVELGAYHTTAEKMMSNHGGVAGAIEALSDTRAFSTQAEVASMGMHLEQYGTPANAAQRIGESRESGTRTGSAGYQTAQEIAEIAGVSSQQAEEFMQFSNKAQSMGSAAALAEVGRNKEGIMGIAQAIAEHATGQKWGQIMEGMHQGHAPFGLGETIGVLGTVGQLARAEAMGKMGKPNFAAGVQTSIYQSAAQSLMNKAQSEISATGNVSPLTRQRARDLMRSDPQAKAEMGRLSFSASLTPENKANWAKNLAGGSGYNPDGKKISAKELPDTGAVKGIGYFDESGGFQAVTWATESGSKRVDNDNSLHLNGSMPQTSGGRAISDFYKDGFAQAAAQVFESGITAQEREQRAIGFAMMVDQSLSAIGSHTGNITGKADIGGGLKTPGGNGGFSVRDWLHIQGSVATSNTESESQNLRVNKYFGDFKNAIRNNTTAKGYLDLAGAKTEFESSTAQHFKEDLGSLSTTDGSYGADTVTRGIGEKLYNDGVSDGTLKPYKDGLIMGNGIYLDKTGSVKALPKEDEHYKINSDGSATKKNE